MSHNPVPDPSFETGDASVVFSGNAIREFDVGAADGFYQANLSGSRRFIFGSWITTTSAVEWTSIPVLAGQFYPVLVFFNGDDCGGVASISAYVDPGDGFFQVLGNISTPGASGWYVQSFGFFQAIGTVARVMFEVQVNTVGSGFWLVDFLSLDIGGLMSVEILNPSDTQGASRVVDIGPMPTDPGANVSYGLAYSTDGNLETVSVTKQGITFTRTLTWTGGVLTAVSTWS